jgi:hypothetical protein
MSRLQTSSIAAVFAVLLAGSRADADQIQWTYDWSFSSTSVHSDGTTNPGQVIFTPGSRTTVSGSSDITAVNVKTVSSALPTTPSKFTAQPYSLIVFIRDVSSGIVGAATFTGEINGTLSSLNSSLHNIFDGPTTQTLHLGHDLYTITLQPMSPPGPPNSHIYGSFTAHVTVQHNPEPSSLVLGGLSLAGLGYFSRRRRIA